MKSIITIGIFLITSIFFTTASAQDFAIKQLTDSPRHHEWVEVKYGERTVHNFVVFPQKSTNSQVVIVIHENRGLTDWVRSFADQLAAEGYIVIAPDFLSEFSPEYRKTSDFASEDESRNALGQLKQEVITADLDAVFEYAKTIPSGNGQISVAGFCWGGSQTFRYATHNPNIKKAFVFYGSAPLNSDDLLKITAPVYGFYGGNDQRVNATIPNTEKILKEAGITYDYVIYPGAGHAFQRLGDAPNSSPENKAARDAALVRLTALLGE